MRDRSFNSWMQRVLFQNYEDWHMKEPNYNRNGFHIIGIDNTLKAMQDGYIPYMELTPPQAIRGCTRMKVTVNKKKDCQQEKGLCRLTSGCGWQILYDSGTRLSGGGADSAELCEKLKASGSKQIYRGAACRRQGDSGGFSRTRAASAW